MSIPSKYRPIPGASGYEISRNGEIRSWRRAGETGRPRVLKTYWTAKGLLTAKLFINGKIRTRSVNKLMHLAWGSELEERAWWRDLSAIRAQIEAAEAVAFGES